MGMISMVRANGCHARAGTCRWSLTTIGLNELAAPGGRYPVFTMHRRRGGDVHHLGASAGNPGKWNCGR